MPGVLSLQQQQYYAHPRNAFWPVVAQIVGFDPAAPYPQRIAALRDAGIALWDVLHACHRDGSLDSDIQADSMIANDFDIFFAEHPHIRRVFFNGAKAEHIFRKVVLPAIAPRAALSYRRLPSTSPAHAALSTNQKLQAWLAILEADPERRAQ